MPVTGVYVFVWVIRVHEAEHSMDLMVNDTVYGTIFVREKNNDDGGVSGTVVAHASRGDVVFVRIHPTFPGDGDIWSDSNGYPSFSGWLLH